MLLLLHCHLLHLHFVLLEQLCHDGGDFRLQLLVTRRVLRSAGAPAGLLRLRKLPLLATRGSTFDRVRVETGLVRAEHDGRRALELAPGSADGRRQGRLAPLPGQVAARLRELAGPGAGQAGWQRHADYPPQRPWPMQRR